MKKLLFIVNPCSGKKIIRTKLFDITDIFIKNGYDVTLYISQKEGDIYNKVIETEGTDLLIVSGGDGSLNELVAGCLKKDYRQAIGYIPTGTTNDFASSLRLPKDPIKCAEMIMEGNSVYTDIGTMNEKAFVYIAAFGALSDISYTTPQSTKNIIGHSAYVLEGMKQLFDLKKYPLTIYADGTLIQDTYCYGMITNTLSVGGIHFFNEDNVDLNDGWFECLFIKYPNNIVEYQMILQAIISKEISKCPLIQLFKAKNIRIEAEKEIAWTLDGEFGGEHRITELTIHNKRLQIYRQLEETKGKEK